jgi:hypothetical protein
MGILSFVANGLGTLLSVGVAIVKDVVDAVATVLDGFVKKGGPTGTAATEEVRKTQDRLREVNEEIMGLRNRMMGRGTLSDADRRRLEVLREERDALLGEANHLKEVKAAEKVVESRDEIERVDIDLNTSHVLQFNAFADSLGKKCPKCGRQMKLQWPNSIAVPKPADFFWGCTGWFFKQRGLRICPHKEQLKRADYALMTDTSAPEFELEAKEFGELITNPGTEQIIVTRVNDLRSDLNKRNRGVELSTCPVHGEHMVLKKKNKPVGLLDAYYLACPHFKPDDAGCTFFEKLKSGSQLAALLKSETGRGIL